LKKINFKVPENFANKIVNLKFEVIDIEGYSYEDNQSVLILASDKK
jgi:hypothetical protein